MTHVIRSSDGSANAAAPAPLAISQIHQGKITHMIYSLLRDERFDDVSSLLNQELAVSPNSRPALSLLAWCYYQQQDWLGAAGWYDYLMTQFIVLTFL
jgi:tetratricopeptide repeat protein 30